MSARPFCAWCAVSVSVVPLSQCVRVPLLAELGERVSRVKTHGPHSDEDRILVALYEAAKGSERIDFQDLLLLTTQLLHRPSGLAGAVSAALLACVDR